MSGVLDGLGGALNAVFGAPVTWLDAGGTERTIRAVFRTEPRDVLDAEGGPVAVARPVLMVPRDVAVGMARGHRIAPGDGKWYQVIRRLPVEVPASDAMVTFELEVGS